MNVAAIMAHQPLFKPFSPLARRASVPGHIIGPQFERIVSDVAARRGVTVAMLRGPWRIKEVSRIRQEAFYELYATGRYSLPTIAAWFGGRDHTTILHGVRAHEARLQAEAEKAAA